MLFCLVVYLERESINPRRKYINISNEKLIHQQKDAYSSFSLSTVKNALLHHHQSNGGGSSVSACFKHKSLPDDDHLLDVIQNET